MLEEEIDLRPYLQLLWRRRLWILGTTVAVAILGYFGALLREPAYQATALVAITEPRLLVQFDPRFETVDDERQPLAAYPELATSDEVVRRLRSQLAENHDLAIVGQLGPRLVAERGGDPTLIRLTATDTTAEGAAEIANNWAELFAVWANDLYGVQNENQVAFFESRLIDAEGELVQREEALVEFQARNRNEVVANQLAELSEAQVGLLNKQRALSLLQQDLRNLQDKLTEQHDETAVSLADYLSLISLQTKAFGAQAVLPVNFQVNDIEQLLEGSQDEQLASVDTLLNILAGTLLENENLLAEIEPQTLRLQAELQATMAELNQLTQDRDIARETYTALARKVEEERITSQDETRNIRVASMASVPVRPTGLSNIILAFLAGGFGFLLATVGIVVAAWWQKAMRDDVA